MNINSVFNGYYEFDVLEAVQLLYLGAWFENYLQVNTFGGINEVSHFVLPEYFGTSVPSTISIRTSTTMLLDPAYMPKPGGGTVTGNLFGYGYNPFALPQVGDTQVIAGRLNITF